MFTMRIRPASVPASLLGMLLIASSAPAQNEGAPVLRTGDFRGVWHGTQVIFSVQQVHANDTFDGVAEVTEGRYKGIKFGFHGKIARDRSLVVTRHIAGDTQVAQTGPPTTTTGGVIWTGETKGFALDGSWPFRLTIPPADAPAADARVNKRQELDRQIRSEIAAILPDRTWTIEQVRLKSDPGQFLEGIGGGERRKIEITLRDRQGMMAEAHCGLYGGMFVKGAGEWIIYVSLFRPKTEDREFRWLLGIERCTTPQEKVSGELAGEQKYVSFLRGLGQIVKKHENAYLDVEK
jgi:hypothetical protein